VLLRFELIERTHKKFWEIWVEGREVVTRFGRIGSEGRTSRKGFPGEKEALAAQERLISEKQGKGYKQVSVEAANEHQGPSASPGTHEPASIPRAAEPDDGQAIVERGLAEQELVLRVRNERRIFQLDGSSLVIRTGRVGERESVQPHGHGSADGARKAFTTEVLKALAEGFRPEGRHVPNVTVPATSATEVWPDEDDEAADTDDPEAELQHLVTIDVSANLLTPSGEEALRGLGPHVESDDQREPEPGFTGVEHYVPIYTGDDFITLLGLSPDSDD
jgi:predicted DNA-binding WGR domain protein